MSLRRSTMPLPAMVRAAFRLHVEIVVRKGWSGTPMGIRKLVPAASCRELKDALRGHVYQHQGRFCNQMDALGFEMSWSDTKASWVVHDRLSVLTPKQKAVVTEQATWLSKNDYRTRK